MTVIYGKIGAGPKIFGPVNVSTYVKFETASALDFKRTRLELMADQCTTAKSDDALLANVQAGDAVSFTVLVERHGDKFHRLAFHYMGNSEQAEDVVQEAFTRLWQKPEMWNAGKGVKFTTWFYRIIVNLCLDTRKKNRLQTLPDNFDVASTQMSQDREMIVREEQLWLEREIRTLPVRQQTALTLCFFEEMSNKEAAEIMGLDLKALQSLIMRAKETLKKRSAAYDGNGNKNG
jgi:RNA polymerase sigma-70 factor (ECF subfamily)